MGIRTLSETGNRDQLLRMSAENLLVTLRITFDLRLMIPIRHRLFLILLTFSGFLMCSCGRATTERLLLNKKWEVYNVTPPKGSTFNIEDNNRAEELKVGFYNGAWFRFMKDSLFIASFGGKADSGKYTISSSGKLISLYPMHGDKIYEQISIGQLTADQLEFNTIMADFHLTLHLKVASDQ